MEIKDPFNKKKYWEDKPNNISSKRPKEVLHNPDVQTVFRDGEFVAMNRAERRKRKVNRLFTRRGFYDNLKAIKVVRKKHGKIRTKFHFVTKSML
jgi:ABC-type sugar transport system ATPase subunit